MVFIGYDTNQERYICHWIDVFGGEFSGLAEGNLDRGGHAIEFTFKNPDGKFTNRFTFDPESQSWTSLMRQEARGEWKLFAEDKSPRSLGSERWSGDPDRWRSARILFLAEGEQTSEAVMARLTAFIGEAKLRFRFLRHAL